MKIFWHLFLNYDVYEKQVYIRTTKGYLPCPKVIIVEDHKQAGHLRFVFFTSFNEIGNSLGTLRLRIIVNLVIVKGFLVGKSGMGKSG